MSPPFSSRLAQSSVFVCQCCGVRTLILRILASNRSCFTALWAMIKLLLALLLDMTMAVGKEKLKAVLCRRPPPSGNWPQLLKKLLTRVGNVGREVHRPPAGQKAMLLDCEAVNQKKYSERHAPCVHCLYYESEQSRRADCDLQLDGEQPQQRFSFFSSCKWHVKVLWCNIHWWTHTDKTGLRVRVRVTELTLPSTTRAKFINADTT